MYGSTPPNRRSKSYEFAGSTPHKKGSHWGIKPERDKARSSRKKQHRNFGLGCFITTACVAAKRLPDDCYELNLLRMFRREYVSRRPDGADILTAYDDKAPKIVRAIDALGYAESRQVYEYLYEEGVKKSVELIVNGLWDEAFAVYLTMCEQLEKRFLREETTVNA